MSDQGDTQEQQQPQEGADQQAEQTQESNEEAFSADYVAKLRKENAKYRTEAKQNSDAAKKLKAFEDSEKSESERLNEQLSEASKRADDAESGLLRYQVASEKEVPVRAMKFLKGDTREDIEASAQEVLELIGEAKPRGPKPDPTQGRSDKGPSSTADQFAATIGAQLK